jgi:hypothetical protein
METRGLKMACVSKGGITSLSNEVKPAQSFSTDHRNANKRNSGTTFGRNEGYR